MDLSLSLQGAGGVGGLVMSEELPPGGGAPIPSFPTYDGNGNITAWVNAVGTVTARQRYDAFGNVIEQTGTAPNRYGFSTKPIELVTGFLYYGYRYYDPVTGRWPSRDPIEEKGGVNLYGFVENEGVNTWDYLGMSGGEITCSSSCKYGCNAYHKFECTNGIGGRRGSTSFAIAGTGEDIDCDKAKAAAWSASVTATTLSINTSFAAPKWSCTITLIPSSTADRDCFKVSK